MTVELRTSLFRVKREGFNHLLSESLDIRQCILVRIRCFFIPIHIKHRDYFSVHKYGENAEPLYQKWAGYLFHVPGRNLLPGKLFLSIFDNDIGFPVDGIVKNVRCRFNFESHNLTESLRPFLAPDKTRHHGVVLFFFDTDDNLLKIKALRHGVD